VIDRLSYLSCHSAGPARQSLPRRRDGVADITIPLRQALPARLTPKRDQFETRFTSSPSTAWAPPTPLPPFQTACVSISSILQFSHGIFLTDALPVIRGQLLPRSNVSHAVMLGWSLQLIADGIVDSIVGDKVINRSDQCHAEAFSPVHPP
jgi:hypothetical protein